MEVYKKAVSAKNILKFVLPTIFMSVIQVLYTAVDGMIVAKFVGTDAMAALTLLAPYFCLYIAVSTMLSAGGSALVMRKMGQGKTLEAKQDFTSLILLNVFIGLLFTVVGLIFVEPLATAFKASENVTAYCKEYLLFYVMFSVPTLLMNNVQIYTIASNNSKLAFGLSLVAGVVNVGLDLLFVGVFSWGVKGAAIATGISALIPTVVCLFYFFDKKHFLHFVKPKFRIKTYLQTCFNGISEFATMLASGVTVIFMNNALLRFAGENGVAAYTIIYYVFTVMSAVYMGYCNGIAPIVSFNFGENNRDNLKKINKISLTIIACISAVSTCLAFLLGKYLVGFFSDSGTAVYDIAVRGNLIFSFALLLCGFNTYASGLFTALSNGVVSAVISFCRTFVFLVAALLLLPLALQIDGVWMATPVAELLSIIVAAIFLLCLRKKYGY